ncbi:MAG: carboxypeptidase-like regulatory domain-containing protein, partial [bacterium]
TTTNAQGSFTAAFTVDSQPYGLKTITATGLISCGVAKSIFTIPIPPGSISGTVTTSTGIPIADVIISIWNVQSTTTDKDGRYKLLNLPVGKYEVQARPKESEKVEIRKDVVVEPGKDTANINFTIDYIHKRYCKGIYISSRHGTNYTDFLHVPENYEIYDWGYYVYFSRKARDNGTFIDKPGNRLVIQVRLDGRWYSKAYYDAVYWVFARKPVVEKEYELGGNNHIYINEKVYGKTTRTYYLYPSEPKYELFKWHHTVHEAKNAWDGGSCIDKENNRLIINVRYEGKTIVFHWLWWHFVWERPAYFSATYYVYGKKEVGKGEYKKEEIVRIPVKFVEATSTTSPKKSNSLIMLMPDSPTRNLRLNTLEEKPKVAIMVKDVEEELTTVRLKLAFNPDKIQVENVGTPTFEDTTTKVHLQKDIDNQAGKIDIGMVIVDEDDVYREEKGTISDKIFSNNQSRLLLEDDEEKEEENIAPLAYLIIDIPQKSRASSYQRTLEQIMNCISIDDVELKDADENVIEVKIDERNITKVQPELNLDKVYCYPNPTRDEITFAKLTKDFRVKIFNIAGELVYGEREHTADGSAQWTWKCINNAGEKVASGIYIYILQDPVSGSMKRGKLGVVR